ncbi:hypothetical protein CRG98_030928 [Punica granatum]|uniref:Uncharacterized protein n=1 Tax=Punica granatum TaxID=22663 RepID=A0A2I0IXE0_PUNGR|nr:hypothetical protein CRG98_030928 [Punica granatum]
MDRVGLDPIGSAARRRKRPGRVAGPNWSVLGLFGPNLRRRRNGPRPVNRRSVEMAGNGGDEAAGGGSGLWTPRFRPVWRKIAEIRDIGDPGPAGSRAAGERCPALPGLPESNLFF